MKGKERNGGDDEEREDKDDKRVGANGNGLSALESCPTKRLTEGAPDVSRALQRRPSANHISVAIATICVRSASADVIGLVCFRPDADDSTALAMDTRSLVLAAASARARRPAHLPLDEVQVGRAPRGRPRAA